MKEKKVFQTSEENLAIELPHNWIKQNDISSKNVLQCREYKHSLLILHDKITLKQTIGHIDFDSISLKLFNKLLISYYLKNISDIKITGEELENRFEHVKTYVKKLPGLQIVNITSKSIDLKNEINLKHICVKSLISNVENCLSSMYKQLQCVEPKKVYFQIQELDISINEIYLLIKKYLNFATQIEIDIEIVSKALSYSKIISAYEKIGDILKRISRYYKTHIENPEEIIPLINPTIDLIIQYHDDVIHFKNKSKDKYESLNALQNTKNSILREIEEKSNLRNSNYTLELVISQLIKDVLGEYDKIIESIIDTHE